MMKQACSPAAGIGRNNPDAGPRRLFLGTPLDGLTLSEVVAAADAAITDRQPLRQVSLNVAKFVAMRHDAELDRDVRSSHLITADGMGIFWAARLLGVRIPERVAGIDIFESILGLCAVRGYRPFFLGARQEVVKGAVAAAQNRYPGLLFAGWRNGYFNSNEEVSVVSEIKASGADCLFIGMPTPRKERFLVRYGNELGTPFIMGVGGSFDVLAGVTQRAPKAIQTLGFEWLFRMVQEPRRLGPRYARTNAVFAGILMRALLARVLGR